ncbi:NCS2 family permease [Enterovibrio paralichthyis]|uniref:NCS2 family permease n=1 Tax=Enterovibrio paralichthyis TaxID=2853805 RepID=UPI001C47CED2|nr:NCS2 family permease [Enterovibrio paralichthyis]MBV7299308.1 NCS2 family permease [Enterovibrio paralichthyis]
MEKQSTVEQPIGKGGFLERYFKLSQHGTSVKNELIGGITTFATMAYIIFVNPNIMSASGMDPGALFVATCIGAAIGTLMMGLFANWPVGLAPGMGLNAFFAFTVVGEMGYSWQVALGAVFISGVIFVGLSISRVREWIINSIPSSLRYAMTAGVGLFLGIIGLKSAGIVVGSPATLVTLGDFTQPQAILAAVCFFIISVLSVKQVFGAVLIGIFSVTLIGLGLGLFEYQGIFSAPPSIAPTFLAMDIAGAMNVGMISIILAFLFVNMFDTAGTLMGVAERANLVNKETGEIEGLPKALKADSLSSVIGACFGCPPVTSYVESAAGVSAGARTGLSAIVVGILFLAAIFLAPLAGMIPAYATAGALIYVAFLMMGSIRNVNWDDFTDSVPAAVTALMMPLTFSISNGIALGFITYTVLKAGTGKFSDISIAMYALSILFVFKLIILG